jgi:hypothetical protein
MLSVDVRSRHRGSFDGVRRWTPKRSEEVLAAVCSLADFAFEAAFVLALVQRERVSTLELSRSAARASESFALCMKEIFCCLSKSAFVVELGTFMRDDCTSCRHDVAISGENRQMLALAAL